MTEPERPSTTSHPLVGPALAAVMLLAWLLPNLGAIDQRFLGVEYVDHYGTQWFYWYAGQILRGLQDAGHTDLFFYPWGKDVYAHTGSNLVDAWLAQPFIAIWGQVEGYNVFLLALMVTNGWAAARLARRWTDDGLVRAVVGVLFAFQPYLLSELTEGRPTQVLMAFVVLFFERFLAIADDRGWKAPVAAGVLLALTGLTYWFYAIFAGMSAVVWGLWIARERRDPRLLARYALAGGVAMALVLPVALPMLRTVGAGALPGLLDLSAWSEIVVPLTREGQMVGINSWQALSGYAGFWIVTLSGSEHFIPRVAPLPPVLLLTLAALILRPGPLPRAPLLAAGLLAAVIAAGPVFIVGSLAIDNPFYRAALTVVPPLQRLWWPGRAFAIVGILAPLGAISLLAPIRDGRWRAAAGVGLVGLLAAGLVTSGLLPASSWDARVPRGYACLAEGPKGAVIDLPYAFTQGHLYYQTAHGRPIMGGMLEDNPVFTPTELTELRATNTFVKAVIDGPPAQGLDAQVVSEADKEAVHALGYEYVVLQLDAYRERVRLAGMANVILEIRLRTLRRSFDRVLGNPVYEDARVAIWAPWGAEPPCDPGTFEVDEGTPGRTDVVSQTRDQGAGREVSHLGRPHDFQRRLAELVVDRNGPEAEAARRILAEADADAAGEASPKAGPPGAPPGEGGAGPKAGTPNGPPGAPPGEGGAAPPGPPAAAVQPAPNEQPQGGP